MTRVGAVRIRVGGGLAPPTAYGEMQFRYMIENGHLTLATFRRVDDVYLRGRKDWADVVHYRFERVC